MDKEDVYIKLVEFEDALYETLHQLMPSRN